MDLLKAIGTRRTALFKLILSVLFILVASACACVPEMQEAEREKRSMGWPIAPAWIVSGAGPWASANQL